MRALALSALLAFLPAHAHAQAAAQTGYLTDSVSISCSFGDHPQMRLVELLPDRTKVGAWSDSAPTRTSGPPATLNVMIMRPARSGSAWTITPFITYPPAVARDSAARGTLSIDGAPAPGAFALNPSMPAGEGPVLQAPEADPWYSRTLNAREARAEIFDRAGNLTGTYSWDLAALSAALRALDGIDWTCTPPAK